jgi:hypothetical protein
MDGSTERSMRSPLLSVFGIHAAADAGLPIQFHVGLGDRDLDLHRVDPMLTLGLLRQPSIQRVPVLLLHCYPFHRQAGYLAQAFSNVYLDVGLAVNYAGVRSVETAAVGIDHVGGGGRQWRSWSVSGEARRQVLYELFATMGTGSETYACEVVSLARRTHTYVCTAIYALNRIL